MPSLRIDSTFKLNDGNLIPRLGLGVYQTRGTEAITAALKAGYRHIDTAQFYANERQVGDSVAKSGLARDEIWVTTKIFDNNHGYERAMASLRRSLKEASLEFFDCVLIHSPNPGREKRLETYRALIDAREQGLVRSIGVSNYGVHHIQELLAKYPDSPPSINQIEISPYFQRKAIVDECRKHNIALQAYSPLGQGAHVDRDELRAIGQKHNGKTPAQVLIRWSLQSDYICLPKSANPERVAANADVYDFELDSDDMRTLNALETGSGVTWDPTRAP